MHELDNATAAMEILKILNLDKRSISKLVITIEESGHMITIESTENIKIFKEDNANI